MADLSEILAALKNEAGADYIKDRTQESLPSIEVHPDRIKAAVDALKKMQKNLILDSISAVDLMNYTGVITEDAPLTSAGAEGQRFILLHYLFWIPAGKIQIILKSFLSFENAQIESIDSLFGNANWLEREIYDLYGVQFQNSRDLRRLLMPDDWKGHPLLKDYHEEDFYRGMSTGRPSALDEKTQAAMLASEKWMEEESRNAGKKE